MITHYLGKEEVAAYTRDLATRLDNLGDDFPKQWFALGKSGRKVADDLLDLLPWRVQEIDLGFAHYDRKNREIIFLSSPDGGVSDLSFRRSLDEITFSDTPVLVLDSAVHSGRSMLKLIDILQAAGAKNIASYTLVLKRGSVFVPTYFGTVIDDKDRSYFQLDVLPVNRLANPAPMGVLREVRESDADRPIADVGAPFHELTVGDLLYDKEVLGSHAYVFEHGGEIVGFVAFRKIGDTLFIDAWGSAKKLRGKKIGSALFRWTETWARSAQCERIELWGFEAAIETYQYLKFVFTEDRWRTLGGSQRYRIMNKRILYNIKVTPGPDIEYRDL